ncbi:MAG TPA: right-handed parallel beta-helix repeat-containing protein [Candidatus Angelobacter sp.]|nr:right-handed parallel beta-helix repeat-containing protein [Candidatus Angelobacter sp.]
MTIVLRGGIYRADAPIQLRPEDSDRQSGPLVIAAAPGERPVLSGAVEIGGWKLAGNVAGLPKIARGKVWVADAPRISGHYLEFRQLWVNDVKAARAREPNGGNMTRLIAWNKTNQTATIPASALAEIKDPARLEMIVDQVWEIAVLRVKSVAIHGTNAVLTFKQPESALEFQHPWPPVIVKASYQAPFFLANAIQFLDSPGEWFEDASAGKVYYWPLDGQDLQHDKVFAPALEKLIDIDGTLDAPINNIEFRGIMFAYTTWLRPSERGHVPLQDGMPLLSAKKLSPRGTPYARGLDNLAFIDRPPGAVSLKNAAHVSFDHCTFEHLASAGLDFQSGTHDDLVEGCTFRDIGGNGIQLGKYSDTNVETHFPYNPPDEREICSDETLANNVIDDCANEDWGCVGIGVGYARGIKVEHNSVSHCSYTGISVGWGWTKMTNALRDNFIHANKIDRVATRLGDTAGIYLLSAQPGTVVSENAVDDITMSPYVPDPNHWYYLYLDEGSSFITVRDNWCPAERFLKNANGPGNTWINNGPQVSQKIRDAAGLEPAFRNLLPK